MVFPIAAIVAAGNGLTITVAEAVFEQPFAFIVLYVIDAVPAVTPVTTPVALTVATDAFELVHVGFELVVPKVVVVPTHKSVVPVIPDAIGNGFTVTAVAEDDAEHPFASVTTTV